MADRTETIRIARRIGIVVIALLLVLAVGKWIHNRHVRARDARVRTEVARVHGDMQELAQAIDAYMVDRNSPPRYATGAKSVNGAVGASRSVASLPSFALPEALPKEAPDNRYYPLGRRLRFFTLTTPIGYMKELPTDPFAGEAKATFVYWNVFPGQPDPDGRPYDRIRFFGTNGWILVSPGPDGHYDLPGEWNVYDPGVRQPSLRLLAGTNKKGAALTYDPTNGTISNGDIWRIKQ